MEKHKLQESQRHEQQAGHGSSHAGASSNVKESAGHEETRGARGALVSMEQESHGTSRAVIHHYRHNRAHHELGGRNMVGEAVSRAGSALKVGAAGSARGIGEVEGEISTLVKRTVALTADTTGAVANASLRLAAEVVKGTLDAAGTIGVAAVHNVSGIVVGVVEGVREIVGAAVPKSSPRGASGQKESDFTI